MRLHDRLTRIGFYTDGELLRWPRALREFYRDLWSIADDSGCLENDPFEVKMLLYPSPMDTDITVEMCKDFLDQLVLTCKKLLPYTIDGKQYLYIKNFRDHQRIDNAKAPSIPLPAWLSWEPFKSNSRVGKYIFTQELLTCKENSDEKSLHLPSNLIEPKRIEPNLKEPNLNEDPPEVQAGEVGEEGQVREEVEENASGEGEGQAVPVIVYEQKRTPIDQVPGDYLLYLMRNANKQELKNKAAAELARRDQKAQRPPRPGPTPAVVLPPSTPEEWAAHHERVRLARERMGLNDHAQEDHGFTPIGKAMGADRVD
ncbi:MAG: hypothetical protein ACYDCO_01860 [Armatimonadota bacterium]